MDRFVLAVDNMNETVMVPSRLMDMSADDNNQMSTSPSVDLHAFYTMLNTVKTELIWGLGCGDNVDNNKKENSRRLTSSSSSNSLLMANGSSNLTPIASSRRMSTVSSLSLSESETDTESCSESDSGLESFEDHSSTVARNFRYHLNGLYSVLQQLTDTADILTCKYQEEVGGAS